MPIEKLRPSRASLHQLEIVLEPEAASAHIAHNVENPANKVKLFGFQMFACLVVSYLA